MNLQPEQKAELEKQGKLKSFNLHRAGLKANGSTARDALMDSIREYLGEDWVYSNKTKRQPKTTVPEQETPPAGSEKKKETPAHLKQLESFNSLGIPKKSKPVDMIQWVASNLYDTIDFADCPGRDALALLSDCLRYPSLRLDFWKTMYTKILPSRALLNEDEEVDEIDGSKTMSILDEIEKIKETSGSA